jgi:hypothetical protein
MSRSDQQLHAVQTQKMLQDHQLALQNGNAKLFLQAGKGWAISSNNNTC